VEINGFSAINAAQVGTENANPKLRAAAHEFEASMMKEFLKPLEHDALFSEEKGTESDDEEGSAGAIMSFGSQAMATAISERGGFGIATLILDHFRTTSAATDRVNNPDHQLIPRLAAFPGTKVAGSVADEGT
jgi:peptidoglycan hydrolase FlgJ